MPRSSSKKTLTNKLDKAWSQVVKQRAGNKCEVCGKVQSLNSHHYISRSNRMLRWDPRNGVCVCAGCHLFKNESFHKNPEFSHYWMEENRWEDLRDINCIMYEIKKWTIEDMESTLEELNNLIKRLDGV
jgi:hypothetical protein